jgi:response regulator RpfG family c-di-GMP phosphodiesterase
MEGRHRVLIAAQPAASTVVQRMLAGVVDVVPAYTVADAFHVLERDSARIDLILTTIAFDESHMVEFLQAVKRNARTSNIPFLCSRVLPGVLSQSLVQSMRSACKQCGAVDLVDIAALETDAGQAVLRAAVTTCLDADESRAR